MPPVNLQRGIREHRLFDLREEAGDLHLQVFLGQDVLADGAGVLGDPVQQVGVYIRADAEAEDARVALALLLHVGHDLLLVRGADGGPSIGEEDHHEGPVARRRAASASALCRASSIAVPPMGLRSRMKSSALARFCFGGLDELVEERLDLGREADDLEPVAVVEVLDAELQGLLGLLAVSCRPSSRRCPARTQCPSMTTCFSFTSTPGEASSRK